MTLKHWMLLGALLAAGLPASLNGQGAAPVPADPPPPPLIPAADPVPPPPAPPATTEKKADKKVEKKADKKPAATAKKPAEKKAADKKATTPERAPAADLKPGPAVATEKNVNVRGQAAYNSEIVTHLKRGDLVTVLEQVTKKAGENEPGKWARISLPAGTHVWVNTHFIDSGKTVKPNRLNLRSGPGENYSILGRLDKGAAINEVERKGDWIKITAPTNAYAFAAAHLFSQDAAQIAAATAGSSTTAKTASTKTAPPKEKPIETKPVETVAITPANTVVTTPPAEAPVTPPVTPPVAVPAPPVTPPVAVVTPPTPVVAPEPPPSTPAAPEPAPVAEAQPLIKRIVTREGIVRGSASIQAPSYFVLRSLDNNRTINYLHSADTNIVLRAFQHQRVIVVGEEMLDERWPNTPVIDVESIEAVP